MNQRTYMLLSYLLKNPGVPFTVRELSEQLSVGERTIRNYFSEICGFLEENGFSESLFRVGDRICFSGSPKEGERLRGLAINNGFFKYKLSSGEREFIIGIILLLSDDFVTIAELEEILFASKVTVFTDLKRTVGRLESLGVRLTENRHKGFRLRADVPESIRREAVISLVRVLRLPIRDIMLCGNSNICASFLWEKLCLGLRAPAIENAIATVEKQFQMTMADEDYYDLMLFLSIGLFRLSSGKSTELVCISEDAHALYYPVAERLLTLICGADDGTGIDLSGESTLLSRYLHSRNILTKGNCVNGSAFNFYIIVKSFLYCLSDAFQADLNSDGKLQSFLTAHIAAMYNRIQSGEVSPNPYRTEMIEKHRREYQILASNMHLLEESLKQKINEDERAYILMHIVAALERCRQRRRVPRVLVLCHGGFGTSHYLAETLKEYFKIQIADVASSHSMQRDLSHEKPPYFDQCDFIISTVPVADAAVPVLQVNALLTAEDIARIHRMIAQVSEKLPEAPVSSPEGKASSDCAFAEAVGQEGGRLLFSDLLNQDRIQLDKPAFDWQTAIRIAGAPLVQAGTITDTYVQAMIENVLQNGPYFVFAPGVALAHADPQSGAKALDASFLRLREPVCFGHSQNDPVTFVVALSVVEARKNLDMLFSTMNTLCKKETLQELEQAETPAQIQAILRRHEEAFILQRKSR